MKMETSSHKRPRSTSFEQESTVPPLTILRASTSQPSRSCQEWASGISNSEQRTSGGPLRFFKDNLKSEIDHILLQQEDARKLNPNIESMTINKLNYDDIGLVGRQGEVGVLRACLKRLILSSPLNPFDQVSFSDFTESMREQVKEEEEQLSNCYTHKELIWIKGKSGAGKSKLAKVALETAVADSPRGLIIEGKFDGNGSDQPYSGIIEAFRQIFQRLAPADRRQSTRISLRSSMNQRRPEDPKQPDNDNNQLNDAKQLRLVKIGAEIARALQMELGDDLSLLTNMFPHLDNLMQQHGQMYSPRRSTSIKSIDSDQINSDDLSDGYRAGQERVKFSFRILMRILSSHFSPLVLIQDDLQRADVASLEILEYLISDKNNPHAVMIVGLYQSNEVDEKHILTNSMRELNKRMVNCQFHMTSVEVGNLYIADVNHIIMKLLGIDDPQVTRGLAELCHKRTLGNPYFVVQFMTMLKKEGILEYNLGLLKWVWDERIIEEVTASTENVVNLLQNWMMKLQPDYLLMMQYAACLGNSFHRSALELIWSKRSGISIEDLGFDIIGEVLSFMEGYKYIEQMEDGDYRWVHDNVQEAALSLIGSAKPKFQFEIGCILYHGLNEESSLEESLFTVVDLINKGDANRRPDFASLNLKAAQMAKSVSAFSSAARYVSRGLLFLPRDRWICHRKLTLKLYTLGAEMELAIGNVGCMRAYYEGVVSSHGCSIIEKLPVYISMLRKLSSIDLEYKKSIDFNLEILEKFGCDLIWRPSTIKPQAVQKLYSTRMMLKQISTEFHERQPNMTDPTKKAVMLLLSKLLYSCYAANENWLLVLCASKMVRLTIKYGVHDASGSSFVAVSTLLKVFFHASKEAAALAETGLLLQQRVENNYTAAMTHYIAQRFVFSWSKSLHACLVPYMEGFNAGMRSGNIEFGLWCLVSHHIVAAYQIGKSLRVILARFPKCLDQTEDLKQHEQAYFIKSQWQMMLNLQGESGETTKLQGEIFDLESSPPKSAMQNTFTYFARLELLIYYGEYEAAAKLAMENGKLFEENAIGDSTSQTETFHRSLAFYAMARKTKQRIYKRRADKARRKIEKWSNGGCPNVRHFLRLLNAEKAALDKKYSLAEEMYQSAIVNAARPGFSQDAALFSERYADFLRQPYPYCINLEDDARYRIGEAIRYYTDWGALKKVEMLRRSLEG